MNVGRLQAWSLHIVVGLIAFVCVCTLASALERSVKTKIYNLPSSPVEIKQSKTTLIETYATPTQIPGAGDRQSRVRYLNRKGMTASQLFLKGETLLINRSPQRVEAVALTVMPMDAFHHAIEESEHGMYKLHQTVESLPRGSSKRIRWEQPASGDIYEVIVIVTGVRFADDSIWMAPKDKIVEIFFK